MKLCNRCGQPTNNRYYCSRKCANKGNAKTKKRRNCLICEKSCKRPTAKTCSIQCRAQYLANIYKGRTLNTGRTHFKKGQASVNYKGYWTTKKGYIMAYHPLHPSSNAKGYIREHRYVVETHLGRTLKNDEVVHHINHNRADNRLANLKIMSPEEHNKYHKAALHHA